MATLFTGEAGREAPARVGTFKDMLGIRSWRAGALSDVVYESLEITAEDYEKYKGKHVVIYKNRVISEGSSSVEALRKALEKYPQLKPEDLEITYVPLEETLIL